MDALILYKAGRLGEAIETLGVELRTEPADVKRRTFLFELLCFAGLYDRAEKQLNILTGADGSLFSGGMLYRGALHAQREREQRFVNGRSHMHESEETLESGILNGTPFNSLTDEDARIGRHLEVFVGDSYQLIPYRYVRRLEIKPPQRLRDLLWAPVLITTAPELGLQAPEVLLPVLTPGSATSADELVQLGRVTVWQDLPDGMGAVPLGQKSFLVDGENCPLLSVRELKFVQNRSFITG